jgi:hypothetical protein
VLALAPTGCGGDDGRADEPPKRPETTTPRTTTEATPGRPVATETAPSPPPPTTTGEDPSTAPLAPGEGDGTVRPDPQGAPDSPRNDTPPPAGSPAERFERDCEGAPGACG